MSVETVLEIIMLGITKFVQRIGADMVVGDNQAVFGDKGPGPAAIEADRGFSQKALFLPPAL